MRTLIAAPRRCRRAVRPSPGPPPRRSRRLPAPRRRPTGAPPPPTPAQQAAARLKVALPTSRTCSPPDRRSTSCRRWRAASRPRARTAGTDAAAKLAARAQAALMQGGGRQRWIATRSKTASAHYKAALALDAREKGREALAEALRGARDDRADGAQGRRAGRALGARRRRRRQQRRTTPRAARRHAVRRARLQGCRSTSTGSRWRDGRTTTR